MLAGKYKSLYDSLKTVIDEHRLYHDPLYTLAFGTDASFYRLIPSLVIRAKNEKEVSLVLKNCTSLGIPVTFRAAGTSLSGQAVTDSVLLIAGSDWKKYNISDDASTITLEPGLTGGKVNSLLSIHRKKIGPDPASINSAMIGGIAANNASGMCCGTALNSYMTVKGMRIVLADGTILDTRSHLGREQFSLSHPDLLSELSDLAGIVKGNKELSDRIRHKYKIKNTTGYSLNALIDFTDPFDILEHLMIGSEGTLGFISEITFLTVPDHPFRASSLMIFPDIENACKAVTLLKATPVSAVELIDRAGLRSVEDEKGIPGYIRSVSSNACALLVETSASERRDLEVNIRKVMDSVAEIPVETPVSFTSKPAEYELLWKIRKGLFPSVGAMRKTGTTVIIEDVAFPLPVLAAATADLQFLLKKYGYDEAVIFGHALDGNLHFVFTQDFSTAKEVERYAGLMDEVAQMVVTKYDGSLKAEHGTGRNMAPYVEMEWGADAYRLMKEIKKLFDPHNILNPGVILNNDNAVHLKNLKPIPEASDIVDKCIECGFCEPSCVSAGLTLTPRQRIVAMREITRLEKSGIAPHITASLKTSFDYAGDQTCATDGLCATSCPVKIDTGKLIKHLREEKIGKKTKTATWIGNNMAFVTSMARIALNMVGLIRRILGVRLMQLTADKIRSISGKRIPAWNRYMPLGAARVRYRSNGEILLRQGYGGQRMGRMGDGERGRKVVYFPSCINRSMGVAHGQKGEKQLTEIMVRLFRKGGFDVIYPENMNNLCCGMAFSSKGYTEIGKKKSDELEAALKKASRDGEYPVVCDMSPCLFTMKENMADRIKLYEPVEFILEHLVDRININPVHETIALFTVCSMKKMGLGDKLEELARRCASGVIMNDTNCCGFAGDRGFTYPELNRHGLSDLHSQIGSDAKEGFSTSRTCEIGLSLHTGITYKSILYLVDRVSTPIES